MSEPKTISEITGEIKDIQVLSNWGLEFIDFASTERELSTPKGNEIKLEVMQRLNDLAIFINQSIKEI